VSSARQVIVGSVEDIPVGEGRTYPVDGEQIAVFRLRDGSLRALGGVCPHKGGPLADGIADEHVVVCPLHGMTYDLRTGAETAGRNDGVSAYQAEVIDGAIRITVGRR
jgi:nitrite reductase (NADH) small subunit